MRILAFSDLHLDEYALMEVISKSRQSDIVLCAGDISNKGYGLIEVMNELRTINKEVIIVPGNNDPLRIMIEHSQGTNITVLHGNAVKRNNHWIIGVGGGVGANHHTPLNLTEEEIKRKLNKYKGLKNTILLTHAPPKGNRSSESILEYIKKEQPLLNICGHEHEQAGKEYLIGRTRVINPGRHGVIINI